jgi:threonine/homoserine/homoserine lactone efflux protein
MSELQILLSIGFFQLLAVISPGPSFLITARTAAAQSRLDGFKVALGLGTGTVVWASATLLGFDLIFGALPSLLVAMKVAGALFLMWVAYQIFRHAAEPVELGAVKGERQGNPYMKGFWTQMSNPKVLAFFSSVFVAMLPSHVPLWMQVALVAIVSFNEVWWYTAVSLFFGTGPVRRFYLKAKAWIDRVTGLFLGVLGLRLLWAARAAA